MSWLKLHEVAELSGGLLRGDDVDVTSVSTDTRSLAGGELFIALVGPNFDGHDFAEQALAAGAAAIMVSRSLDLEIPQVIVDDTRLALGRLASGWRHRLNLKVIGLTGSNGKTTVKEMIASILGVQARVLATRGNLNNDIGVPLTLLSLREADEYAVIEMGANHQEEIRYLTSLVSPDVGLVNNAGPAHLEGFGDLDGVARGKGELFETLGQAATAVVNADDAYADYWLGLLKGQSRILFGSTETADIRADLDADQFVLEASGKKLEISLALPGRHNRMNALAAAATALAAGVGLDQIRAGLEALQPVAGRLNVYKGLSGSTIIDDTYNANPASFKAGIEVLAARHGKRILVMGDMGELGERTAELHGEVGAFARQQELDLLMAVGANAAGAATAFGSGGRHFAGKAELIADLRQELAEDVTALVKGSRSMAMEEVVEAVTLDMDSKGEGREHAA